MTERGNVLQWSRPADRSTVTLDKQVYGDMTNLLADLLFDRAGGRQDDHAFLLRHCGRLSLIVAELLCPRAARDRDLDS
jgi:hypothetical protein